MLQERCRSFWVIQCSAQTASSCARRAPTGCSNEGDPRRRLCGGVQCITSRLRSRIRPSHTKRFLPSQVCNRIHVCWLLRACVGRKGGAPQTLADCRAGQQEPSARNTKDSSLRMTEHALCPRAHGVGGVGADSTRSLPFHIAGRAGGLARKAMRRPDLVFDAAPVPLRQHAATRADATVQVGSPQGTASVCKCKHDQVRRR